MPGVTQRGHANTEGSPATARVTAASLQEAVESLEASGSAMPTASRGLEAEVVALRETMEELIFILKVVNGL